MIDRIKDIAMEMLQENRLENATDTVFALKPEFTPSYHAMVFELQHVAGYQVRVVANMFSLADVPYDATDEHSRAATRKALRTLMVGMRNQAVAWLDAHPETTETKGGFEHL